MPALLEDPETPTTFRRTGQAPFPTRDNPAIPSSIFPRPVTLRDRVTIATLIPFFSPDAVPQRLLSCLCDQMNKEIEDGNTYPMSEPMSLETFGSYWFGNFGAVMVLGDIGGIEAVNDMERGGADWSKLCLGSFYVKPNYPGRSSHVCNGGFLVTAATRNKGVGKSMGQCYLDWAPQLGYTYSVFNLVYETNTASTKIWDSLGFKRIGRIPACGHLNAYDEPVDAIIYGRDLKSEEGIVGNEERFDKIRYYLRHSLYPQGADRSEKSRLRSAATHYKLIPAQEGVAEKLMLKDKEVISDPHAQYEIAKQIHLQAHGGINKTTAIIATKYHWVRIKETVSHVIKNCPECKDTNKPPILRGDGARGSRSKTLESQSAPPDISQPLPTPTKSESSRNDSGQDSMPDVPEAETFRPNGHHAPNMTLQNHSSDPNLSNDIPHNHINSNMQQSQNHMNPNMQQSQMDDFKPGHMSDHLSEHISPDDYRAIQEQMSQQMNLSSDNDLNHDALHNADSEMLYEDMAIDPQIMEQIQAQLDAQDFDQQQQAFLSPTNAHQLHPFNDPRPPPPLSHHPSIHSDAPGPPPQFHDNSHIQNQNNNHERHEYSRPPSDFSGQPGSQYISPVQHPNPMMGHPVPDDHIMSGQSENPDVQHVLSMEYMNIAPDNSGHYQTPQRQ